ncbi:hypothetical protein BDD12DRAFT_890141 [Trichophaea hybrida]|nr:hypothetical protein BDD12DRAFT_890141 [Trichophaea hybrida]
MATAAGLALAVFPLVVKGLSIYLDGSRKIKDLWHWKLGLRCLIRELKAESVLFHNTCTNVLDGIFSPSEVTELMAGNGWGDQFMLDLEACWGAENAHVFVDAVNHLSSTLEELRIKLGLDENMKPESLDKAALRKQWKQIKLVLEKDEPVKEISRINSRLERLVSQLPTSIRRLSRRVAIAKNYLRIREHAVSLHSIFHDRFQRTRLCKCLAVHNANLQLTSIPVHMTGKPQAVRFNVFFSFDITSKSQRWREMEFKPIEAASQEQNEPAEATNQQLSQANIATIASIKSGKRAKVISLFRKNKAQDTSPVATNNKMDSTKKLRFKTPPSNRSSEAQLSSVHSPVIENLCLAITESQASQSSNHPLGTILGEGDRMWQFLCPSEATKLFLNKMEAVSLETLLKQGILRDKGDRLQLGVKLASSMMQLHTTEWLGGPDGSWGKRDIFVLRKAVERELVRGGKALVWEPILDKPFVCRTFGSNQGSTSFNTNKSPVADYDKNLFSLGIVLIELSLQSCIEDLRDLSWSQEDQDRISPVIETHPDQLCDNPEYITANQRIGEVFKTEQEDYGLAVQRCINGMRLPDETITKSLDNLQYKNEVHINIISLLERNLKTFIGSTK